MDVATAEVMADPTESGLAPPAPPTEKTDARAVIGNKKRVEQLYTAEQCSGQLRDRSVANMDRMACSTCMKWMSDRSEPRRAMLRALHPNCTDKRVGDTARRADALYVAACGGKDNKTIRKLAKRVRFNADGRSKMYSRCWDTTRKSLGTTVVVPLPL